MCVFVHCTMSTHNTCNFGTVCFRILLFFKQALYKNVRTVICPCLSSADMLYNAWDYGHVQRAKVFLVTVRDRAILLVCKLCSVPLHCISIVIVPKKYFLFLYIYAWEEVTRNKYHSQNVCGLCIVIVVRLGIVVWPQSTVTTTLIQIGTITD